MICILKINRHVILSLHADLCITTLYMGEHTYFYYYRNFSRQYTEN